MKQKYGNLSEVFSKKNIKLLQSVVVIQWLD